MTPPDKPTVPQWMIDAAKDALTQLYGSNFIADANKDFVGGIIQKHHAASQRWIPCEEQMPAREDFPIEFRHRDTRPEVKSALASRIEQFGDTDPDSIKGWIWHSLGLALPAPPLPMPPQMEGNA
jgi:hypothetical protein